MPSRGFTLLEIIVVLAIIAVVASLSVYFGTDSLRAYSYHSDRDLFIAALEHARAEAVGNVCHANSNSTCTTGRPHGVHVAGTSIVIFQTLSTTPDYTHRDASVDTVIGVNQNTKFSGASDVVFSQLSGNATPGTITLSESTGKTSTVAIGNEGQIFWTN